VPDDKGHKPSLESIRELIANSERASLYRLQAMAESALFDLNLWDYDYSAPGAQTYLERVESVDLELDRLTQIFPPLPTKVPLFYHNLSTSHFVSGAVRNIGYTYAEIASRMMAEFISDELQRLSGRRSWHAQPALAGIFRDKFFSQGWRTPFPGNIEAITGRKFDPSAIIKNCSDLLLNTGRSG
ncbi:MAG: hypothetical protein HC902_13180, partial [Calothrix sp. SM1_5_4]|nr:hypothetical protein [Calothrix sp. SM1_5_4]